MQYIWQFQYFNRAHLNTISGEAIEIVFPGRLNKDQGPDFADARIRIGTTLLVGSVELHLKTSEWNRHGHQHDANYNNVILHVVFQDDAQGTNAIPILELQHRISKLLLEKYEALMQESTFIPCAATIAQTRELTLHAWKERLVAERLTRKSSGIFDALQQTSFHWEEVFWRVLARNFGIKVNAEAFEQVAQTLPITLLARHKTQIHQLEALLLGQAGLLQGSFTEDYPQLLQREYHFLNAKYHLQPSPIPVHFLRMRPQNFPTIRLAQLAMLVHQSQHLFSKLLETKDLKKVKQWLGVTANDYWHYHYRLDEPSEYAPKKLGESMIDNIIINTVIPVLFAYGLFHNKEELKLRAIQWLEETEGESNSITNGFKKLSLINQSAFDSQALIELKNEYCNYRRCLECAVGNSILKRSEQ